MIARASSLNVSKRSNKCLHVRRVLAGIVLEIKFLLIIVQKDARPFGICHGLNVVQLRLPDPFAGHVTDVHNLHRFSASCLLPSLGSRYHLRVARDLTRAELDPHHEERTQKNR